MVARWPGALIQACKDRDAARAERDRARDVAVALEQENAELLAQVERILADFKPRHALGVADEGDFDGWAYEPGVYEPTEEEA